MSDHAKVGVVLRHTVSRVLHTYADLRIGALPVEKRCYKQTDSVLLTFDDYGSEATIDKLLAVLGAKQVRAMFFLQGDWAKAHSVLTERIRRAGHIVGNHTLHHQVLLSQPVTTIKNEITGGLPGPWFRPPEGRYNRRIRELAASLGFAICYWSIDSRDWTGASVETMQHTIMSELHPGAVILFHIEAAHTLELLPTLIDDIRARGYAITDFSEVWSPAIP